MPFKQTVPIRFSQMKYPHKFVGFVAGVALTFPMATIAGTNFQVCLANVQNGTFGVGVDVGGTDDHGYPVNVSVATGMTYHLCIRACGGGQEPFQWSIFSQQFSSWLLPWLALISQVPFGANDKLENLNSVFLTVGSPTLAAYSLALTVLNSRWVTKRFERYTYYNVPSAIRILSSLQQSPIKVVKKGGLLASLIVLHKNDKWWKELVAGIDYTHSWSISAVTSIAWVVIAYIFTIISSFTVGITNSINSNGQGVGSLWLWLLPVVIGWLQISPKCDSRRLNKAIKRANKLAYIATDTGKVVRLQKVPEIKERAIELTFTEVDDLHRDEKCTVPVFNYARFLPWVQAVEHVSEAFKEASRHYSNHESVNCIHGNSVQRRRWPQKYNERREGTKTQVIAYCTPQRRAERPRSRWGSDIVSRMFIASALALMLQWGTAGAAFIQVWYTPTRGLGCRSASYLLYAVLSTIVWMLLVASSILTHYASKTQNDLEAEANNEGDEDKPIHGDVSDAENEASHGGVSDRENEASHGDVSDRDDEASRGDVSDHGDEATHRDVSDYEDEASRGDVSDYADEATHGDVSIHGDEPINEDVPNPGNEPINEDVPNPGDEAINENVPNHRDEAVDEETAILEGEANHEGEANRHWPTKAARRISILCRRLGKVIAAFNTLWVVVACIFQFASVFDNCYCNSSVFWLHDHAYNVIALLPGDIASVKSAWVGALFLAGGTATGYLIFVNVFINPRITEPVLT